MRTFRVLASAVLAFALLPAWQGSLRAQLPGALVIRGVTLIDGNGGAPVANATVVVRGNRIEDVATGTVPVPAGAEVIDAKGKYLIPGLMDIHIHLRGSRGADVTATALQQGPRNTASGDEQWRPGIRALHSYLYAGVTTVYDAGNRPEYIMALRDKERKGEIVSPRILATGGMVASPDGHGSPYFIEAWPQDRAKLEEHVRTKPDMVKIGQDEHGWGTRPLIHKLAPDLLEKIIRYYHEQGLRVTIHVSNEWDAWDAIYAGVDSLAHPIIQGPVSDRYLRMMSVKHVPTASTLTIGENYSRVGEHPEFLDQPLYRDTVEPEEIQRLKTEESAKQKENRWAWWMKVMTPVAQENLKKLNDVGKDIVACGTDQTSGPAVHRELELLVGGGISPADAIVIATRNSARYLGKLDTMGTIEKGKLADLVLLSADPTKDVNNLKAIDTVIKDGKRVDRSKLDLPVNRRGTSSQP